MLALVGSHPSHQQWHRLRILTIHSFKFLNLGVRNNLQIESWTLSLVVKWNLVFLEQLRSIFYTMTWYHWIYNNPFLSCTLLRFSYLPLYSLILIALCLVCVIFNIRWALIFKYGLFYFYINGALNFHLHKFINNCSFSLNGWLLYLFDKYVFT